MGGTDGSDVHPFGSTEGEEFDLDDFNARYVELARLLGLVTERFEQERIGGDMRPMWAVLIKGTWYRHYDSERKAAAEYIRLMGFQKEMWEALRAIFKVEEIPID